MIESIVEIDVRRVAAGASWSRVCKVSGVHFSTVRKIQTDPSTARVGTLEKLSEAVTALAAAKPKAAKPKSERVKNGKASR